MRGGQSLSPAAIAVAIVAVLVVIGGAYVYLTRNTGGYYGGPRTVPKAPPFAATRGRAPMPR